MSENSRDTQFAGFAKALWEKLMLINTSEEAELIIARSAYDLTKHVLELVPHLINTFPDPQRLEDVIPYVPDLTELPKEQG